MKLLASLLAACSSGISSGIETNLTPIQDSDAIEVNETGDTSTDDTGEDTSEDTDPVTPTGYLGGVVQVRGMEVPCPQCFGFSSDFDTYSAIQFHDPVAEGSWTDKLPPVGTCAPTIGADPAFGSRDVGPAVRLNGPGTITLPRIEEDGVTKYRKQDFGEANFVTDSDYSILSSDGETLVENAVHIPAGFDWVSPSLILSGFGSAYSAPIRRNLTNEFTWTPPGDDLFVVGVEVYDSTGSVYKGGTVCVDFDDGSYTMPVGPLQGFEFGDLAAVYMYRWHRSESMDETTGHTIEGVGITGVIGTGVLID